ncbi:MAG: hypothetical protein AVO33_01480 [delta proteobacterium ML8_F1]|nr:MAG: hypothetical protein AVO33_01480 [delta proteobacterium ML8_F1]
MIPAHIRPESLEELLTALDTASYTIFAGGTDLLIRKRQWQGAERRFEEPLAFINHLEELKEVVITQDHFLIGALATQEDIASNEALPDYLREPYRQMATLAIRNIATVGGNLINAASVGDSLPVLLALDARVILKSVAGERSLTLDELIVDKYRTAIKKNEVLTQVIIPRRHFSGYYYKKIGQRKASILSKLSVILLYRKNKNLEDLRIAVGAVNSRPLRLKEAERTLLETGCIDAYLKALLESFHSEDDKRSTREYRETVTLDIIRKQLEQLFS